MFVLRLKTDNVCTKYSITYWRRQLHLLLDKILRMYQDQLFGQSVHTPPSLYYFL
jgi:hypothetical protein